DAGRAAARPVSPSGGQPEAKDLTAEAIGTSGAVCAYGAHAQLLTAGDTGRTGAKRSDAQGEAATGEEGRSQGTEARCSSPRGAEAGQGDVRSVRQPRRVGRHQPAVRRRWGSPPVPTVL